MFQYTKVAFKLLRDFSLLTYYTCPGTCNYFRFSTMFELNHSPVSVIAVYMYVYQALVGVRPRMSVSKNLVLQTSGC